MADSTVNDHGTGSIDDLVNDKAKDSAPKSTTTKRRSSGSRSTKRNLTGPLTELYASLGMGVFLLNQADGALILEHGPNCAEKLNDLAKQNDKVYAALDKLVTGGAMGAVVMAHTPIVLGILNNHQVFDSFFSGKSKDGDSKSSAKGTPDGSVPSSGNGVSTVGPSPYVPPVVVEAR